MFWALGFVFGVLVREDGDFFKVRSYVGVFVGRERVYGCFGV